MDAEELAVSDLDEELKRVRLQREKLALQEDERRIARRRQGVDLAHAVAATTADFGARALWVAVVIAICWTFGMISALAFALLAAAGDLLGIGGAFGHRLGFYGERYLVLSFAVWLAGAGWCYFRFFKGKQTT